MKYNWSVHGTLGKENNDLSDKNVLRKLSHHVNRQESKQWY